MQFLEELECLIGARYPLIYLVSSEENRVQQMLLEVARRRHKQLYEWSCTTGLALTGTSIQSQRQRTAPSRDPLVALEEVIDQIQPAIFLFKDLHPFLARQHHTVIRRLKEIAVHLKNSRKTLVVCSPVLEVPPELEKEFSVLSLPLPNVQELGGLLDGVLEEVQQLEGVQVELDDEGRERWLQAALGLTLAEAENVFAKVVVKFQRLNGDDVGEIFAEKQQVVRKNGLLEYCTPTEHLDEVGGLEQLKDWLARRALAFSHQAREFGLPSPRGVLLLGVQGCGKSLCAKAVANLWQLPLLRFDMGRMFGSFVGSSEENVRRAISVAESVAPSVLWVDEIDKAFAGSQGSATVDGGTAARVFGTFLTWLSEKKAPVFVVATANEIAHLPPELLRKGRLDEIFFVDLPTAVEREAIFRIHLHKRGRAPESFNLEALAAAATDFSGAEIEEAVVSGLYDAFYAGEDLADTHVQTAVGQTVPLARTMSENVQRLRQWAAGRARAAGLAEVGS